MNPFPPELQILELPQKTLDLSKFKLRQALESDYSTFIDRSTVLMNWQLFLSVLTLHRKRRPDKPCSKDMRRGAWLKLLWSNFVVKTLLYLAGIPGAGKTTLLNGALEGSDYTVERSLFQKRIYPGGVMLGGDRLIARLGQPGEALFSGTDALQRHIQPAVIKWFADCPYSAVVGEGDRLCNRSFFEGVLQAGWKVQIIVLNCPLSLAFQRQIDRRYRVSDMRFKIACTKVMNIMGLSLVTQIYDARLSLSTLIDLLRQQLVMRQIRGL